MGREARVKWGLYMVVKGEGGGWAGRHEGEEQVGGRWGTGI